SPEALEIRRADPSASGRVLPPDGAPPRRPGRRLSGWTTDTGSGRRLLGAALQLCRGGAAAEERAVRRGVPAAGGMDHGTRPGLPPRRRQRLTSALAHFNHNVRLVWNRAGNSADWSLSACAAFAVSCSLNNKNRETARATIGDAIGPAARALHGTS